MQTQFKIMGWAVVKCPSVELKIMGESLPSLLDSGSMVSLMWKTIVIDILGCSWDQLKDQWLTLTTCLI